MTAALASPARRNCLMSSIASAPSSTIGVPPSASPRWRMLRTIPRGLARMSVGTRFALAAYVSTRTLPWKGLLPAVRRRRRLRLVDRRRRRPSVGKGATPRLRGRAGELGAVARRQAVFQPDHFGALRPRWLESSHRLGLSYFHGRPGTAGYPEFNEAFETLRRARRSDRARAGDTRRDARARARRWGPPGPMCSRFRSGRSRLRPGW